MRVIELNATDWNTTDDFYNALLAAIGAPEHHGRNLNALIDSMLWGGINAIEPPYIVRISGATKLPKDTHKEIELVKRALAEARAEFRTLRGCDAEVDIEADSTRSRELGSGLEETIFARFACAYHARACARAGLEGAALCAVATNRLASLR